MEVIEERRNVGCSQATKQEDKRGNGGHMVYLGSDLTVLAEAESPLRPRPSGV